MAKYEFQNNITGRVQAAAVLEPKYTWIDGRRIRVFTGADMPSTEAVDSPASIVLTTRQLIQGADFIARTHALAIEAYIRRIIGVDAKDPADAILPTGTYTQLKYWKWDNKTIVRSDVLVNALRTELGLTPAQMDNIFIAGSTMPP